jgi:hypothetical protein
MHEEKDAGSAAAIIGIMGLAFAVLGICDLPIGPRLGCLLGGSICLPMSFHRQPEWPGWVRWTLSLIANSLLGYVAWSASGAG